MIASFSRIMYGCIVFALISGSVACGGTDNPGQTSDSVATVKPADSTKEAPKKRKKRQTSISGFTADNSKMVKDANGVYNRAEKEPEFPGGQTALTDYVNTSLSRAQSDFDNVDSGAFQVTIVVDENGKVLNPEVINNNSLGKGIADETLTAFNKMPSWTPGMVHGRKVKTRVVVPIRFQFADTDQ